MAVDVIQTMLVPTRCTDGVVVDFYRDGDHYVFYATNDTLQATLRLVGDCARHPELNLTWDDAAKITQSLRRNMPEREVTPPDASWIGWMLIASCSFWFCLVSFLTRMF